jgi:putative hydrolase of the HAD superfamily
MINSIIFDFGDVFIDLDKAASEAAFKALGLEKPTENMIALNHRFEIGKITEEQFLSGIRGELPTRGIDEIRAAWNSIIGEFPLHRLEFLQMLCGRYRLFLLTNTDSIHIDHFEQSVGMTFARDFYKCFEKVYYSYELGMRKPDKAVFEYLIRKHDLRPERTLFVDDKKENTDAAAATGMQVWNLKPGEEDVVHLFEKKFATA